MGLGGVGGPQNLNQLPSNFNNLNGIGVNNQLNSYNYNPFANATHGQVLMLTQNAVSLN